MRRRFSTPLLIASIALLLYVFFNGYKVYDHALYKKIISINDYRIYSHTTSRCSGDYDMLFSNRLYSIRSNCQVNEYIVTYRGETDNLIKYLHDDTLPNYVLSVIPNYSLELKDVSIVIPNNMLYYEKNKGSLTEFENSIRDFVLYYNHFNENDGLLNITLWQNINTQALGEYDLFISANQAGEDEILARAHFNVLIVDEMPTDFENRYIFMPVAEYAEFTISEYNETTYLQLLREEFCTYNGLDEEKCAQVEINIEDVDFDELGEYNIVFSMNEQEVIKPINIVENTG